jgi:PAS domain S-box-containing protein
MSNKEKIKTQGFKLSLIINTLTLILLVTIGYGIYFFFMSEIQSQKLSELKLKAQILSNEIFTEHVLPADSLQKTKTEKVLDYFQKQNIAFCVLTNAKGLVVSDYNIVAANSNSYLLTTPEGIYKQKTSLYKLKSIVLDNSHNSFYIYLGLNTENLNAYLLNESGRIIVVLFVLLGLFYLGLFFLYKFLFFNPLRKIAYAAQSIVNGSFEHRARYRKNNELGVIASGVNYLVYHLDKANNQISGLSKELKTIVKDKIGELNLEVNQRRLAEHKLRQSEEQFRLLFERAPIGMVITSIEGKIIRSNSAFCETLGYSSDEISGKNISELTLEDYLEYDRKLHTSLLEGNLSHVYYEKELKQKNGTNIHAIVESVLTRDESNHPHHIIQQVIDITERKKVERELIFSKEKAEESDRLKSAFLAQMSHEIRTPLNVILTATPLLAEDLSGADEDINVLLDSVSSAGRRLQRTIDMILNLSSVQSGNYIANFEAVNLNADLKKMVDEMKSLAMDKNLSLSFSNNVYEPLISADKYTVNQIFQNLIGNAIKYTQAGKIDVQIIEEKPGKVNVEIRDTGIGMSDEYMEKLFTPFSQEDMGYKREFEGNGLGLALVKKYVELNNAEIFVKSQKKKGTCFKIIFSKLADKKVSRKINEDKITVVS